jgi:hypothetical protein
MHLHLMWTSLLAQVEAEVEVEGLITVTQRKAGYVN